MVACQVSRMPWLFTKSGRCLRRRRPLAFQLLGAAACLDQCRAAQAAAALPSQGDCRNPLFETHWAGKSDVRHLEAEPTVQSQLRFCPAYNGRLACCPAAFEHQLEIGFDRWVEHWRRKAQHIRDFQVSMARVRVSPEYVDADRGERALFEKALESFGPVLAEYGTCFDTLLEYMAGMLCFSCDPLWQMKVHMDANSFNIAHLRVDEDSNEALWESCRGLGRAADSMHGRVSDSGLVKRIWTRFEDFHMFFSKIKVSEYMERAGLQPLRAPSELQLHLNPSSGQPVREMMARTRQLESVSPATTVNPVHDGQMSGFKCSVFPRKPVELSSRARGGADRLTLAALICVVLSAGLWPNSVNTL